MVRKNTIKPQPCSTFKGSAVKSAFKCVAAYKSVQPGHDSSAG